MCDTPLEVGYMLRETEARSRSFAAAMRDDEAVVAGIAAKASAWLQRLLNKPFAVLDTSQEKAN